MFFRCLFALVCTALMLGVGPALSADGTVTVNGEVISETCIVNGGVPSFSITLPNLSIATLSGIGSTAGRTHFSIAMTSCTAAGSVNTYFEPGPTINAAGRLINQSAGGATVDGQIQNADGSVVNLAAAYGFQNTTPISIVTGSAIKNYDIVYFANTSPMGPGAFSSSVVYSLLYQ